MQTLLTIYYDAKHKFSHSERANPVKTINKAWICAKTRSISGEIDRMCRANAAKLFVWLRLTLVSHLAIIFSIFVKENWFEWSSCLSMKDFAMLAFAYSRFDGRKSWKSKREKCANCVSVCLYCTSCCGQKFASSQMDIWWKINLRMIWIEIVEREKKWREALGRRRGRIEFYVQLQSASASLGATIFD